MAVQIEDEPKPGAPEWMVTFADLMSLLLTFFVLLLSFSSTEVVKFKQMAGSLKEAFGMRSELALSDTVQSDEMLPVLDPEQGSAAAESASAEVMRELQQMLAEMGLEKQGGATITPEGVVLQLSGDLFFASGRAELNPGAFDVLDKIAQQLQRTGRPLDVIGHTDDIPIATPVYPSNWELSAARAGHAVRYLSEQGVAPGRLRAIGQAQTAPVDTNDTAEGRSRNRRVEFVFRVGELEPRPSDEENPGV